MMLEDLAYHAYDRLMRNGGITVNMQGVEPTEGYAYSPYPELERALPQAAVTPQVIAQYLDDNQRALSMPGNFLGAWLDTQSGNVFLDISHVGPPTPDTIADAKKQKQIALFDLANAQEIPTGVTYEEKHGAVDHQAVLNQNMGQNLQGLPGPVNVPGYGPLQFHSNADIQRIANEYNQANGLGAHPADYTRVNPQTSAQIAQEYERMPHAPNDPNVAQAYDALARETRAQYDHAVNNGYRFEFYPQHDPYPNSPREAVLDLHHNKHMYVYPTETGYGMDENSQDHPLLGDSGVRWNGRPVTHNDLFRAIHDFYGHAKEGVGFRADGEDNAWRQHAAMFSDPARRALTSETRGQNSWVNFGPHAEHNQTATSDTIYAPQKAGLMPDWTMDPELHRVAKTAAWKYDQLDQYPIPDWQPGEERRAIVGQDGRAYQGAPHDTHANIARGYGVTPRSYHWIDGNGSVIMDGYNDADPADAHLVANLHPQWHIDPKSQQSWDDVWGNSTQQGQSLSYTREGSTRLNSTIGGLGMWRFALNHPLPGARCYFHPDRPAVANAGFANMCQQCTDQYQHAQIGTAPDMRTAPQLAKTAIWELPEGYGLLHGPQYPEENKLVAEPGRMEGYEDCPQCHAWTKMPLGGCPHCGFNKDEWSERWSMFFKSDMIVGDEEDVTNVIGQAEYDRWQFSEDAQDEWNAQDVIEWVNDSR
jgi:hypothetical protein